VLLLREVGDADRQDRPVRWGLGAEPPDVGVGERALPGEALLAHEPGPQSVPLAAVGRVPPPLRHVGKRGTHHGCVLEGRHAQDGTGVEPPRTRPPARLRYSSAQPSGSLGTDHDSGGRHCDQSHVPAGELPRLGELHRPVLDRFASGPIDGTGRAKELHSVVGGAITIMLWRRTRSSGLTFRETSSGDVRRRRRSSPRCRRPRSRRQRSCRPRRGQSRVRSRRSPRTSRRTCRRRSR
jgi:hypothetical protein